MIIILFQKIKKYVYKNNYLAPCVLNRKKILGFSAQSVFSGLKHWDWEDLCGLAARVTIERSLIKNEFFR